MLFASATLARRIEAAECAMLADVAGSLAAQPGRDVVTMPLAGGLAVFAGFGSPINKVAGLGFGPPINERELAAIESAFAARKAPVQVELATLADPEVGKMLTRRGYALIGFENLLGARIDADAARAASPIEVRRIGSADQRAWMDVLAAGFARPDVNDGPPSHEHYEEDAIRAVLEDMVKAPGFVRHLAYRDGVAAGAASMRVHGGIAQLCGAATLHAHRRHGVQTALLRMRLDEARAAGCDIATITTLPGSKSHENAQNRGFEILYARAILVR